MARLFSVAALNEVAWHLMEEPHLPFPPLTTQDSRFSYVAPYPADCLPVSSSLAANTLDIRHENKYPVRPHIYHRCV